jgi:hypothetical protein
VERPLALAAATDQQVVKEHQVQHLALLPQVAVVVAVIILIQAQAQASVEVEEEVQDTDMLVDSVQVLLVPQVKDILEVLAGMAVALHIFLIAEQLTQAVVVVVQANLAIIVKVQTSIPPEQAAFQITTAQHNDGM